MDTPDRNKLATLVLRLRCQSAFRSDDWRIHTPSCRRAPPAREPEHASAFDRCWSVASTRSSASIGRTCILAGLLILPLIWSFVTSLHTANLSVLIALDVWVLGICIFWNAREAFLPPVTPEELDALLQSPKDLPHESAQMESRTTLGWHARLV